MDQELVCRKELLQPNYSSWRPVTSAVSHGSVLGPLLFPIYIDDINIHKYINHQSTSIYINDLDNGIARKISEFTDDAKLFHSSRYPDEILELQEDLNWLEIKESK